MDNSSNVPREDIVKAYFISSELVATHGPAFLPAFERMQKEVDRLELEDEMMARARSVFEGRQRAKKEGN